MVDKRVRRDLVYGWEISELATVFIQGEFVGKGKQEICEPYQRKDFSLRVCATLLISCLHKTIYNRKTIENRPKIKIELNETRKVREDFLWVVLFESGRLLEPRKCQIHIPDWSARIELVLWVLVARLVIKDPIVVLQSGFGNLSCLYDSRLRGYLRPCVDRPTWLIVIVLNWNSAP
jgi:hypothetical protein